MYTHTRTHTHSFAMTIMHVCINNRVTKKINVPSKRDSCKVRTKLNRLTKHALVTFRQLHFRNYVFKMVTNSCSVRFNLLRTVQYRYYSTCTVCVASHDTTVCRRSILGKHMEFTPHAFLHCSSFPQVFIYFFKSEFFSKTSSVYI
jgi:hypothetical protein